MILFPPAKINLGLNVLFKRNDGFHELETVMVQIPLFDALEIHKSENFQFESSGINIDGNPENNLCVKAFQIIKEIFNIPNVFIHLRKNIPMGAGMGGGSADGAFVLRGLNELFNLQISNDKLREYAAKLGSDCPFFIEDHPQFAKGRGEILEKININLTGLYLKVINIGIHVGTKEAYSNVQFYKEENSLLEVISQPISKWKDLLKNSFESSVFQIHPQLNEIKSQLYSEGAIYATMSGSGSTMFGIFETEPLKTMNDSVLEIVLKF